MNSVVVHLETPGGWNIGRLEKFIERTLEREGIKVFSVFTPKERGITNDRRLQTRTQGS